MGGFWAHGWNITKIIFIYAPFLETHLQVRQRDGFSRTMAQTTRTRARMCLFGNFSHFSQFRGQKPKNPQFWGVNRRFQAKLAKSKNVHIFKTTASIPTKFCTVIKTTKWPSWVVPTHALQIQDGGRPPPWKNWKIVISQPRFNRFWPNLARWSISNILTVLTVKNLKLSKSKMAAAAIFKIRKIAISRPRFKMAVVAILKNLKTAISQPQLGRFWRNLAWWCNSTTWPPDR